MRANEGDPSLTLCLSASPLASLGRRCSATRLCTRLLRIQQSGEETYQTSWRVPAKGELRLGIYLEMPQHCKLLGDQLNWKDGATFVEQGNWSCPGGLVGHEVRISGLEMMLTDALARFERLDGTTQVARLSPSNNSFTVTMTESWAQVASTYLALGVKHILLGIDHLLFVLALLLLVPNMRMLVWTCIVSI